MAFDLDACIRKIPDFPKPGILFYDITGVFQSPEAFAHVLDRMTELYQKAGLDGVVGIEARGFLLSSPFALRMKLPLVLVRKKGKLPGQVVRKSFKLEYGEDTIEVHAHDVKRGGRYLVVDDLIATGGTLAAACSLLEEAGGVVAGIFGIIGLPFLRYGELLAKYETRTLIDYAGDKA